MTVKKKYNVGDVPRNTNLLDDTYKSPLQVILPADKLF